MEENNDLRESLRGMQTELVNLLNRQESIFPEEEVRRYKSTKNFVINYSFTASEWGWQF